MRVVDVHKAIEGTEKAQVKAEEGQATRDKGPLSE